MSVVCAEGTVTARVKVDDLRRFALIHQHGRITRSDHIVPRLAVRLTDGIQDGETWWVSLTSAYGKLSYEDKFQTANATALIFDPDPGTVQVAVRSTGGYACVQEIDLVEITRYWDFDARTRRFAVDKFAHVVTLEDRTSGKKAGWYREMRENAAEKR